MSDRDEVRAALKIALKIRRRDAEAFEELFALLWAERRGARARRAAAAAGDGAAEELRQACPEPSRRGDRAAVARGPEGGTPGYSPEALLRKKPFDECTERDLAEMERLLARLALALATRKSRRLVPTRGRGRVDLRRSLRRAVATDGEIARLARARPAPSRSRVSSSSATRAGRWTAHVRFLLAFLLSLKKARPADRALRLQHLADAADAAGSTPAKIAATLDRLAAGVPGWSGGTQIGECLAAFVDAVPRRDGRRRARSS